MHARWNSTVLKGISTLAVAAILAACGTDDVVGPGPAQTEFPPIAGTGGGSPLALRLNEEMLKILPKKTGQNFVFDAYSHPQTREVAWSRLWTRKLDFTGVTWDSHRTMTMITPRHVVMAKHFVRNPGDVVRLHDRRGREVQRVLQGVVKLEGPWDVAVGILNEAVPSGVAHYKLLEPSDTLHEELLGTLALVTDGERLVHVHECGEMSPITVVFRFPRSLPKGFYESLIAGDSGNPSFLLIRGELVLLETHHRGGAGAGPFYGSAQIQEGIRAAIAGLATEFGGGEYSFETIRP